jgi:hypothetical protein
MSNEQELQLKLDAEGRTISPQGGEIPKLDYSSKSVLTLLADDSKHLLFSDKEQKRLSFIDDLLLDSEITDCALLPRTFWVNCQDQPRCAFEQCALEVFRHHVQNDNSYDPDTSGAEWWVQIRPSPPAGRYSLLIDDNKDENSHNASSSDQINDLEASGICFHWDKDEDLRLMMGGNMYIHPHISTVTYLTSVGAPTLALNYRVNPLTGEYMPPQDGANYEAYVSCPKKGKHLSFDGRYLHAAPKDLMPDGLFENQIKISNDNIKDPSERKKQSRRHRRVTFLVNIWLNYKPFNVDPFPDSMIDKMTKVNEDVPFILFRDDVDHEKCHEMTETCNCGQGDGRRTTTMKWPMGGCGSKEVISMDMPLESIRNAVKANGNIRVIWERTVNTYRDGVCICFQEEESSSHDDKTLQPSCQQGGKRPKLDAS